MKKSELLEILEKMKITPSKRFGQNFMIDENLLDFIVRQADIKDEDLIIEIGPGCGVLTRKLLDQGALLTAIEIDKRICDYLSGTFIDPNFHLQQGDACRIVFSELFKDRPELHEIFSAGNWKCIANLPYSISSPFIAKLIESGNPPEEMLFLLQKETGERFAAKPGTSNYGSLSVLIQLVFDVRYIRTVSPQVFFPPPDIKSALVGFRRKDSFPSPETIKELSKTVRTAFSQRRKKMIKALSNLYGKEKCIEVFAKLAIDENTRAEKLSPEEFLQLNTSLNS
jgi:16S rRNA (adenine1518-N6/adenine1519-N6)-dimethyltransferase